MTNTLIIAIDDSGQLSTKDTISGFGGIILLNNKERDKFVTQYKKIVSLYKCKYCRHKNNCNNICPELKHYNLKPKHIRHILNYLKQYKLVSCTINNSKVYNSIINDAKSKGRFLDYAIKMMVKNAIKSLIDEHKIDKEKDLEIIFYIDENSYKSNGYYDLENSIYAELKYGMKNFKNNSNFKNIIDGNLTIKLYYRNSYTCYFIQAADLIAGSVRKRNLKIKDKNRLQEELKYINYKIYLP